MQRHGGPRTLLESFFPSNLARLGLTGTAEHTGPTPLFRGFPSRPELGRSLPSAPSAIGRHRSRSVLRVEGADRRPPQGRGSRAADGRGRSESCGRGIRDPGQWSRAPPCHPGLPAPSRRSCSAPSATTPSVTP